MSKGLLVFAMCIAASILVLQQSARAVEPDVVISGVTIDCAPGQTFQVSNVFVAGFDLEANQPMLDELRVMDTVDFEADLNVALDRLNAGYWRLDSLLTVSAALAMDSTNSDGVFRLNVPPMDSVLVVAHAHVEGEAFYYAYKVVPAQNDTTVVLDMTGGQCTF